MRNSMIILKKNKTKIIASLRFKRTGQVKKTETKHIDFDFHIKFNCFEEKGGDTMKANNPPQREMEFLYFYR